MKAVFFDFDGTLRHSVPLGSDVFDEYVSRQGLLISVEDRRRAGRWEHWYWAGSPALQDDLSVFGEEQEGFWRRYAFRRLVALGLSPALATELAPQVWKHMEDHYHPQDHVPEDAREVLPALREAGYLLAVISNRDLSYDEKLADLGLAPYFRFSVAAGEIQAWKPDPAIFEYALQKAGIAPSEAVYIGDNYYADVVGARSAGLHVILYDPRHLFPDPDCAVVRSFVEVPDALDCLVREAKT